MMREELQRRHYSEAATRYYIRKVDAWLRCGRSTRELLEPLPYYPVEQFVHGAWRFLRAAI